MGALTYNDALELLGYTKPERRGLEILGYEYSIQGRRKFRADRLDIEPVLTEIVCSDLRNGGVFPRDYAFRQPECGVFIQQRTDTFILVERDKPSVEARWTYKTAAAAAHALVRRRCDHAILLRPEERDDFVSVEYSWDEA